MKVVSAYLNNMKYNWPVSIMSNKFLVKDIFK